MTDGNGVPRTHQGVRSGLNSSGGRRASTRICEPHTCKWRIRGAIARAVSTIDSWSTESLGAVHAIHNGGAVLDLHLDAGSFLDAVDSAALLSNDPARAELRNVEEVLEAVL